MAAAAFQRILSALDALPRIAAALTAQGRLFVDGGSPLRQLNPAASFARP